MVQGEVVELRPEEVLMLAIDVERISGRRLRNFADFFVDHSAEAAGLFAEMAAEVEGHRSRLESLYKQRYGAIHTPDQDEGRELAEAHGRDDTKHPESHSLSLRRTLETLSLRRALETVLDAERHTQDFYQRAVHQFGEADLQALLRELSDLEAVHIQQIEASLNAIRGTT